MRDPKKILQKMLLNGWTQKEIAVEIDVAESTVSRVLSGAKPRLDTAERIWQIPAAIRARKPAKKA